MNAKCKALLVIFKQKIFTFDAIEGIGKLFHLVHMFFWYWL